MLHGILLRLALMGGEGALVALFFGSVTTFAVICERLWYLWRRHIKLDTFVQPLVACLRSGDLRGARTLAQSSENCVCVTALAGLMQVDYGPEAVRHALATAMERERLRMDNQLAILTVLARISILVGIAGTLCDLLTLSVPEVAGPLIGSAVRRPLLLQLVSTLVPCLAGLCVSVPAYLAAGVLGAYVQRRLRECDFISRLIRWQLPEAGAQTHKSSRPTAQAA